LIEYAVYKGYEKDGDLPIQLPLSNFMRLKSQWEKSTIDPMNSAKMRLGKGW